MDKAALVAEYGLFWLFRFATLSLGPSVMHDKQNWRNARWRSLVARFTLPLNNLTLLVSYCRAICDFYHCLRIQRASAKAMTEDMNKWGYPEWRITQSYYAEMGALM
jgi:hypothetical protein